MGAGDFPAGDGPAGHDPVAAPSASPASSPPMALLYDPQTRDFRLGSDGRFVEIHPVDQEVALAIMLQFGTVGSSTTSGSKLLRIKRAPGLLLESTVGDIVRQALSRPLARGDITISNIDVSRPNRSQTLLVLTYVNNRLQSPNGPTTLQVPLV